MVSSRKPKNVTEAVANLKSKNIVCEGVPCHVGSGADRQALIDATLQSFGGKTILMCENMRILALRANIVVAHLHVWRSKATWILHP